MPEDRSEDEKEKARVARASKAFSDYYMVREDDGSVSLLNGAHIVRFEAKPEGDTRVLVMHLADGSHHVARTEWAANFIDAVFVKADDPILADKK